MSKSEPVRRRGTPLTDADKARIIKTYLENPRLTYKKIGEIVGCYYSLVSREINNYLNDQAKTVDLPAPVPNPPQLATSAEGDDWTTALRDFMVKFKQPIPEQYRELFGIVAPQVPAPYVVPTSAPIIHSAKKFRRIAMVSDVHLFAEEKIAVATTLGALTDLKPDCVVLGGDIFDCYDISDYDRSPDRAGTLQDEFDGGRYFIDAIEKLCPDVTYLEGNHENRLVRLIGRNPGLYKLRSLDFPRAANLPAHWRYCASQTHFHIGKLAFLHGDVRGIGSGGQYPAAAVYRRMKTSCIFGHFHRFNTHFERQYDGVMRGAFANGHLSDLAQVTFQVLPNWQTGFSLVEMSEDNEIFAVQQYLIINGRTVVHGKEYSL